MNRLRRHVTSAISVLAAGWALQVSSTPALADETGAQKVEQLANKAYQLHAEGRFAEAIATYLSAYEIGKAAELLFNVASIYDRKLHERELAAEYYRRYILAADADPNLVKRATERLTALKREADEAAAPPAAAAPATANAQPAPPPPPPAVEVPAPPAAAPSSSGGGWRVAGVVIGGTGLAGVAVSLALGAAAKSANDDANAMCNGAACRTQQGVDDAHRAGVYATASTASFIGGLGLVAAGVTMYLAAPRGPSSRSQGATVEVSPAVGQDATGLVVAGRF